MNWYAYVCILLYVYKNGNINNNMKIYILLLYNILIIWEIEKLKN